MKRQSETKVRNDKKSSAAPEGRQKTFLQRLACGLFKRGAAMMQIRINLGRLVRSYRAIVHMRIIFRQIRAFIGLTGSLPVKLMPIRTNRSNKSVFRRK
ncbi:hypothetical protein QWJ34_16085 [Saccharibacillus sp. CPCC 101409]|uniref:hypothetical protein n=1 Tax=Saccharibacillus sp. CPCC 101409 TaxID=3058041 RepID=UPI002670D778|nr:hypothetical protein [Saccharibacillus sp. CPCC 101409]MDO3411285.1 hypothetical protein [Saccharibacillus sp. CPCC 101409]